MYKPSYLLLPLALICAPMGFSGCTESDEDAPSPIDPGGDNGSGNNGGGDNGGGDNGGGDNGGGDNGGGDNGGGDNGGGDSPSLKTAEDWARARIAGTVSTEEAFNAIAYDTGFPVHTDDSTILFMHWYDGGNWAVAGDFNNWNPQEMTQNGDIWYTEVPEPAPGTVPNYKFVKDGRDYQSDPWSLRYNYDENGEISYYARPAGAHLMRWNNFQSPQGLKTRTLRVYVPGEDGPYDVLYAHDGQNLFNPNGAFGSWKVQENMASIGGKFLVVGIDNSEDRMVEYTHVDDSFDGITYVAQGDRYAKFVEESVRPFIEKTFRTTGKNGLMGSSLGGLISLYIAHLYPEKYRVVLALSPTTAWGDFGLHNPTIRDIYVSDGHRDLTIYVDSGGGEGSGCKGTAEDAHEDEINRDNYCYTKAFADALDGIGYEYEIDLFHWFEPGAEHNEAAWAARLFRPLEIFRDF